MERKLSSAAYGSWFALRWEASNGRHLQGMKCREECNRNSPNGCMLRVGSGTHRNRSRNAMVTIIRVGDVK